MADALGRCPRPSLWISEGGQRPQWQRETPPVAQWGRGGGGRDRGSPYETPDPSPREGPTLYRSYCSYRELRYEQCTSPL